MIDNASWLQSQSQAKKMITALDSKAYVGYAGEVTGLLVRTTRYINADSLMDPMNYVREDGLTPLVLRRLLAHLPEDPDTADIILTASGVQGPLSEEPTWQRYLAECEANQIIPFSTISLGYDAERMGFVTKGPELASGRLRIPRPDLVSVYLRGGRIHQYHFHIENGAAREGYQRLKSMLIGELAEADYQPLVAELRYESSGGSGANQRRARAVLSLSATDIHNPVYIKSVYRSNDAIAKRLRSWIEEEGVVAVS